MTNFLLSIKNSLGSLFVDQSKKTETQSENSTKETKMTTELSEHFTYHDALYLPSWKVEHIPTAEELANIKNMAQVMEKIRALCGNRAISISCWIRPTSLNHPGHPRHGQNYNLFVGSTALHSMHIVGGAVDFVVNSMSCDDARLLLSFKLKEFNIRMEKNPGSSWVHCDIKHVNNDSERYFLP
jgi:hypothetical protein